MGFTSSRDRKSMLLNAKPLEEVVPWFDFCYGPTDQGPECVLASCTRCVGTSGIGRTGVAPVEPSR